MSDIHDEYDRMPKDPRKGRGWRITKAILTSVWFKVLVSIGLIAAINSIPAIVDSGKAWIQLIPVAYLLYAVWKFIYSHNKGYLESHDAKSAYLRNSKQVFLCPHCKKDALVFRRVNRGDSGTPGTSFSVGGVSGTVYTGGYGYEHDYAVFECPRCKNIKSWIVNEYPDKEFKEILPRKSKIQDAKEEKNWKKQEKIDRKEELEKLKLEDKKYKEEQKAKKLEKKQQKESNTNSATANE